MKNQIMSAASSFALSRPTTRAATLLLSSLLLSSAAAVTAPPAAAAPGAARAAVVERGFVGKMERALADRLAGRAASAEPVNVVYLLRSPVANRRAADGAAAEALASRIAAGSEPVVRRLEAGGHRVIYRAKYAAMVVTAANAASIRAAEADPDVERIYLERVSQPRLGVSRRVIQADIVNGYGITGQGVTVAVVEAGRIGSHPQLRPATLCRRGASGETSGHKTNVAGIINNVAAGARGIAPAVTMIDGIGADFSDAQMMAATDCAIHDGAVAINYSFGTETDGEFGPLAHYVEETVYNTGRSIVVAVSNFCANRMGTPEIAFNALAVGAFSDRDTAAFLDDRHACDPAISPPFSAFLDPLPSSSDREEPDLVAPGHLIRTTRNGGNFDEVNGTSFAAPHVTAGIALLHDRLPELQSQPERVRAILMASARHNIEGATALSDRDGAGAILLEMADRVLRVDRSWDVAKPGEAVGFPHAQTFPVARGQRVRVALAWAQKPSDGTLTELTTNLDLDVVDPRNNVVGSSVSRDNNYEIVEFVAASTGNYTLRVHNIRPSPDGEFLGLAVSQATD
jgi:subtilisin family serine protease